jgi:hypothetical protein
VFIADFVTTIRDLKDDATMTTNCARETLNMPTRCGAPWLGMQGEEKRGTMALAVASVFYEAMRPNHRCDAQVGLVARFPGLTTKLKSMPRTRLPYTGQPLKERRKRQSLWQSFTYSIIGSATFVCSFGLLGANVSAKSTATLCTASEKVIFSCRFPDQKRVSLCAARSLSTESMLLRYRFGKTATSPELVFPPNDVPASDRFWFYPGEPLAAPSKGWMGPSRQLGFESGGHAYALEIYSNRGTGEHYANLIVKTGSGSNVKVVSDRTCDLKGAINRSHELEKFGLPNRRP